MLILIELDTVDEPQEEVFADNEDGDDGDDSDLMKDIGIPGIT